MNSELRRCNAKQHTFKSSPHQDRDVSVELFRKNANDPKSPLFKVCIDCRLYSRRINDDFTSKHITLYQESIKKNNGYLYCPSKHHKTVSKIAREQVPINMFRRNENDPKSSLLQQCSDCRNVTTKNNKDRIHDKKIKAVKEGKFFCTNCHHTYDISKRALNLDKTPSILCLNCKDGERERSISIRDCYKLVKMEHVIALNACCRKCRSVFIRDMDKNTTIELKRSETQDECVLLDGEVFPAKDIILDASDLLELDILHLDHLTENEQRERGLLLSDEIYIPKVRNVSKMSSEEAIRLEALKCQLLCARCHVEETVRRETGLHFTERSHVERQKFDYTNNLKSKGCALCLYSNVDLLRFFHFDHIDPKEKMENISRMVKDNKYTLEDVKKEMEKCRILCAHCHIIHTKSQKRDDVFNTSDDTEEL